MDRKLDGVFFRINRDGKWQNICWSDLTDEEMDDILKDKDLGFCQRLCKILGHTIHSIGDELDIMGE